MIAAFSVVPVGSGTELKEQIAEVLQVVDESGLPYRLNAMTTEIEGEWDEVMEVVREAHEVGRKFTGRVLTHISIDDREGATGRIEGKVSDVEEVTGKKMERKP
ncbi:MAG: MTH1187 family thiamine-binding protein [Candidatus Brocadiia bacterium]